MIIDGQGNEIVPGVFAKIEKASGENVHAVGSGRKRYQIHCAHGAGRSLNNLF